MARNVGLLVVLGGLLLTGCQNFPRTAGEVSVSRPQVFTRERLLNERLGDLNWLRDQLDRPFEQGFQGFRDVREAAAFVFELQAKLDIAQRRAANIKNSEQADQAARSQELALIQQEIDKTKLQQQLDQLKKSTAAAPSNTAVPDDLKNDLAKLSADINALSDKVTSLEAKVGLPKATNAAKGLLDNAQARLVNPNLAENSRASLSSRDRLEDEASFRDFVNGRIREASLDDTHDLNGSSLFELKFDATIVPGTNTRRSAIAEIRVMPPAQPQFDSEFVQRLVQRIEEDSNALIMRQHDRARVARLNQTWKQRINGVATNSSTSQLNFLQDCGRKPNSKEVNDIFRSMSRRDLDRVLREGFRLGTENTNAQQGTLCLITEYVRMRLDLSMGRNFKFDIEIQNPDSPQPLPLIRVAVKEPEKLQKELVRLSGLRGTWVATVAPKEYAQNISDVASAQQIRQISAALEASDGKGLGGSAKAESFRQEQEISHAIKRQPLAASFVRGDDAFGWVLGPKYEIKGGKPSFLQSTSRYTFTASVVVPAWFNTIELQGCGYWVESDGTRSLPFSLFTNPGRDVGGPCGRSVEVRLPHSYRAVMHALMDSEIEMFSEPEMYVRLGDEIDKGEVKASIEMMNLRATPDVCRIADDKSCEQSLVIEGRDLWRNPSVFVGDQRADRVDVLPSMRGIVATFKNVRLPSRGRNDLQDILVSTSAGQDRINDAVAIASAEPTPSKAFARLAQTMLERDAVANKAGLVLDFEYLPSAFPRAYAAILAQFRTAGGKWIDIKAEPAFRVGGVSFHVADITALGLGSTSEDVELNLLFKYLPGEEWVSVVEPGDRRATYFANRAERELTFASGAKADVSTSQALGDNEVLKLQNAMRFSLPSKEDLFYKAYPGLRQALEGRGGIVSISLQFDEDTGPVLLTAERFIIKGRTFIRPSVAALRAKSLELIPEDERSITYKLKVQYRRGGGDWKDIALNGTADLAIKGLKRGASPSVANKGT